MGVIISLIIGIISFTIMILAFFLFQGCINLLYIAVVITLLNVIISGFKVPDNPLGKIGMVLCAIVGLIGGLKLFLEGLRGLGII